MGPVTQEDPIGIAGGLNLYGYANGDPINFSDPFGLCPKDAGGDGETDDFADCEEGTSGWYAHRIATGEGSELLNTIGGTLASCGESMLCQGVLAAASVGASLGASGAAAAAESGGGAIVIGETMARVEATAGRLGAETFQASAEALARGSRSIWRENRAWLEAAVKGGRQVIDIGIDVTRPVRSRFYRAEKLLLQRLLGGG